MDSNQQSPFPQTCPSSPFFTPSGRKSKLKPEMSDRFIPKHLNFDTYAFKPIDCDATPNVDIAAANNVNDSLRRRNSIESYRSLLKKNLSHQSHNNKIINYSARKTKRSEFVFESRDQSEDQEQQHIRPIPKNPYKILEAPKLKDDFYYNILDWNKDDLIAVSLSNSVYIWTGRNNEADKLGDGRVSSIKFCHRGIALGDETGVVKLYDVQKKKPFAMFLNHLGRVGSIDFNHNLMVTGSKDQRVIVTDIRSSDTVCKLYGHKQEVCGVKWSYDGTHIASGGNDNKVLIWSNKMNKQIGRLQDHTAAVKGLAWSPHRHSLLATGGGTSDKTIKMWNTQEMSLLNSVDTGSQICNMVFSENVNELLTTHGYSLNTVSIWRQKDMKRIATLHGHNFRVLYLAVSPDGESVVTGSGDETLRFWKVFPAKKSSRISGSNLDLDNCTVR